MHNNWVDPHLFEDEVRRIARNIWPSAQYQGSKFEDGKERDGVFETEECIHLLESTALRTKDKASKDCHKLASLANKYRLKTPQKPVQCWFITYEEPTADQRKEATGLARKHNVSINALSFLQFQAKIIDVATYLESRKNYPFGSIRDPRSDSPNVNIQYIPLDICDSNNKLWSVKQIAKSISTGTKFELLGDYGAGKSMTLREIFKELRKLYFRKKTPYFPIYLNLRDHQGQKHSSEILERHARNIGFSSPHHLVRAWHTGYVHLILDGFDEITSFHIQGKWRKLQNVRYRSMEAVRSFIDKTPLGSGLIIAGREHFFDNMKERNKALGTTHFTTLSLNDFTEEQIDEYKKSINVETTIPTWMPTRPLLLGTLLLKGVFSNQKTVSIQDPGVGWDLLLREIANREAKIEAGIDGEAVRHIFEDLATKARSSMDGLGPLTKKDIFNSFTQVCGFEPDESAMVLLLRLPGLGVDSSTDDSRKFIDHEFVDACRAGDIYRFIKEPFNTGLEIFKDVIFTIGSVATSLITSRLLSDRLSQKQYNSSIDACHTISMKSAWSPCQVMLHDLVLIANSANIPVFNEMEILNVMSNELSFDNKCDLSKVTFKDCYFSCLALEQGVSIEILPNFIDCYFAEIDGLASPKEIPILKFSNGCIYDTFTSTAENNNGLLNLPIDRGQKATLSILNKVYTQRGSGRIESALYRGLDFETKQLIPDALKLLLSEGFISIYSRKSAKIYLPVKDKRLRVGRIISKPNTSSDSLLTKASALAQI